MPDKSEVESIGQFIHKESSKEKLQAKGLMPLGKRKDQRLKEGSTSQKQTQMPNEQQVNRELSSYRLEKLRVNAEIDSFLAQLLSSEMINQDYFAFHAKAIHTLGIEECRRIYLNALNGSTPQRLYAYKIKGALQVHYKQIFDRAED